MEKRLIIPLILLCFLRLINSCQSLDQNNTEDKIQKLIDTNTNLAQALLDQNKPAQALQNLLPMVRKFPQDPKLLNMLGLIHLTLKNYKQSTEILERTFNQTKKTAIGLNLSSALIASKDFKNAKKLLMQLVKDTSYEYPERLYHNLATVYHKTGDLKKATAYYKKSLSINPIFYLSALSLGKLHQETKNSKLAVEYWQKASEYCPSCFEPVSLLAKHYCAIHQCSKSEKLLRSYASHPELSKNLQNEAQILMEKLKF